MDRARSSNGHGHRAQGYIERALKRVSVSHGSTVGSLHALKRVLSHACAAIVRVSRPHEEVSQNEDHSKGQPCEYAFAARAALAAQLRLRHVRLNPLLLEYMAVDPVPDLKIPLAAPHDPRKSQFTHQWIGVVIRHPLAVKHAAVQIQHACDIQLASQHALADKNEVIVPIPGLFREEKVLRQSIYRLQGGNTGRQGSSCCTVRFKDAVSQGAAQSLGQVRVPSGPIQDTAQEDACRWLVRPKTPC